MSSAPILPIMGTDPLQHSAVFSQVSSALQMPASFADMLTTGIASVNDQVIAADRLATAFVLDDSIPVHQVTFALEQARLSLELMLQVRGRLVEGYQQLMNMQL